MAANEFSLWIIAAVLVWLPIAAVFYLRVRGQLDGDGGRRTTTAHKVIVSLYLFINIVLAAGALFAALYSLIRLAVGFDGLGVSDLLVRVVVPALCMVLVHVWMMTAYSPSRRISRKIFTGSILALSLLVTISLLAVSITTIRGQASDTKKEADLEVLRSEVNQYYSAHQTLPNDLDQLDIAQGQLKNKRSTYTYKVQSNRTYQLCADFARETADANLDYKTSTSSSSSRDMYATYANFSQHPKGTHCFSLSAGYGYYDPMPVLPMSDTSKSDTNL
jgi:competence protein ComGC